MASGVSDEYRRHVSALIVVLDIYPDLMKEMISNTWPPPLVVKLMNGPTGKQLVHCLTAHQQNIVASMKKDGYKRFDIDLMYKIIRQFGLVDEPSQGWGNKPKHTDVNQGDDIERIRRNRNDIVHRPRLSITDKESKEFFTESVNIAIRMDSILQNPSNGFQNRIKDAQSLTVVSSSMGKQYLDSCPHHKGNMLLEHGRQLRLYISGEITHQMENNQNDLESTECILYVRDPAMNNSSEIVKVLENAIYQINEEIRKIKLKAVEEGSLIIHVIISQGLTGIDCLCKEITMMFNSIYELDYINKNCGTQIEVVLAESAYTINKDQIAAFEPVTFGLDKKTSNIFKMNVAVHNSSFQSAQTLCEEVNGIASSVFSRVDTISYTQNGSSIGSHTQNRSSIGSNTQNGSSIDIFMVFDHKDKNVTPKEGLKKGTDKQVTAKENYTGDTNRDKHSRPDSKEGEHPTGKGGNLREEKTKREKEEAERKKKEKEEQAMRNKNERGQAEAERLRKLIEEKAKREDTVRLQIEEEKTKLEKEKAERCRKEKEEKVKVEKKEAERIRKENEEKLKREKEAERKEKEKEEQAMRDKIEREKAEAERFRKLIEEKANRVDSIFLLIEEEKLKLEKEKAERCRKEKEERVKLLIIEAERMQKENEEKTKRLKEEVERIRKEKEERLKREKEEAEHLRKEAEKKRKRVKEEAERLRKEAEEKSKREKEEAERLRRQNEEKVKQQKQEAERLQKEKEETTKREKEEAEGIRVKVCSLL